jgi:hypothetical protein
MSDNQGVTMLDQDTIKSRLAELASKPLSAGAHADLEKGMCIMEATAYVAGEDWSDHPKCACPVIGAFMRAWNDGLLSDDRETLLRPLIPQLVNTRGSKALEQRRATMAADWLIRVHTPAWLRLAKLEAQAAALEGLPEITDFATCPSLMSTLDAVRSDADAARDAAGAAARDAAGAAARAAAGAAAWDAARAAAWAAAWAAAGDAAGAAARAAAGAAAWAAAGDAAGAAAWDAAGAAAGDAAGAAAGDAAGAALKPTQVALQQSALALVHRMIAARDE